MRICKATSRTGLFERRNTGFVVPHTRSIISEPPSTIPLFELKASCLVHPYPWSSKTDLMVIQYIGINTMEFSVSQQLDSTCQHHNQVRSSYLFKLILAIVAKNPIHSGPIRRRVFEHLISKTHDSLVSMNMTDFFKCCFPSARDRREDDEFELVSAAVLMDIRHKRHNNRLTERTMPQVHTHSSNPYSHRRRPSEDLQDLVDNEAKHDNTNEVSFRLFDRAHAHVLRDLNATLQHSLWAVSGSYAEALWACRRGDRRNIVSIMCQRSSRDTTKLWLTSQSLFAVSPNDENVLQYQGDLGGADPVAVRIRWVSDWELQRQQIIESTFNYRESPSAPVTTVRLLLLSLPALADNIAWSWVNARNRRARDDFAEDLFSVMDRIVDLDFAHEGSGPLSAEDNVRILSKEFWIPFTDAYPHALALFAQCGAPIPDFAVVSTQPRIEQGMQMPPSALRPDSFKKPRSAPVPPLSSQDHGRSLTTPSPSSRPSSSSRSTPYPRPPSSSKHRNPFSIPTAKRPSTRSDPKRQHVRKDEIQPVRKSQKPSCNRAIPISPEPSRPCPIHPANTIHPEPAVRSKLSALFGLSESPETMARRRQEQFENDRAARRASEKLAAKIQRNRERDREREWHTRKQAERMEIHEPPRNAVLKY